MINATRGGVSMLSPEELKQSPIFDGISYESYLSMIDCFQAIQKTYRPEDVAYDFERGGDQVGILERGEASLIRIDEDGVSTVMENLTVGSVFGRSLAFSGGCGLLPERHRRWQSGLTFSPAAPSGKSFCAFSASRWKRPERTPLCCRFP